MNILGSYYIFYLLNKILIKFKIFNLYLNNLLINYQKFYYILISED